MHAMHTSTRQVPVVHTVTVERVTPRLRRPDGTQPLPAYVGPRTRRPRRPGSLYCVRRRSRASRALSVLVFAGLCAAMFAVIVAVAVAGYTLTH